MNSEEIILMKMADIVFVEKRPFSLTFYPLNMKIGDINSSMGLLEIHFQGYVKW
jgi:hypothetical protein